jgi:hypothetical protein
MDTSGISTGSSVAVLAQKAGNDVQVKAPQQAESVEQSYLSKLERLGSDHPLTKFLGGFWSQHVDTEA